MSSKPKSMKLLFLLFCWSWGGGLVSHLVSPLLDGLHVGGHDGWLGDLPDGGSHEGSGLGQAQAVGDGGGDRGRGHGGSGGHRVVGGQGSQAVSSVGVGHSTVEQDLGLGVGRGEGKNNLRGDNSESQVWGWNRIVGHLQTSAWCGLVAW